MPKPNFFTHLGLDTLLSCSLANDIKFWVYGTLSLLCDPSVAEFFLLSDEISCNGKLLNDVTVGQAKTPSSIDSMTMSAGAVDALSADMRSVPLSTLGGAAATGAVQISAKASTVAPRSIARSGAGVDADTPAKPSTKLKISVFQALTLIIQKYKAEKDSLIYRRAQFLYLSGVQTPSDESILKKVLQDPVLAGYTVSADVNDIDTDPVRRYFESQLCHESLKYTLDALDIVMLQAHWRLIFERLSRSTQSRLLSLFEGTEAALSLVEDGSEGEYVEAIYHLKEPESYPHLKPSGIKESEAMRIWLQRKEKMILLAKCSYTAYVLIEKYSYAYPLNMYGDRGGPYQEGFRGREKRLDPATGNRQSVHPQTLGIMRSYMPLPESDALLRHRPCIFTRPVDRSTYTKASLTKKSFPSHIFATKVTPFVNSLSGTMLLQLRVIAQLMAEGSLIYQAKRADDSMTKEQLKYYIKSYVAFMIYNSGGHSLLEYMLLFEYPEIKAAFKALPGFNEIGIEQLFKDNNSDAYLAAQDLTCTYNESLLKRKRFQDEISSFEGDIRSCLHKPRVDVSSTRKTEIGILDALVLKKPPREAFFSLVQNQASIRFEMNRIPRCLASSYTHKLQFFVSYQLLLARLVCEHVNRLFPKINRLEGDFAKNSFLAKLEIICSDIYRKNFQVIKNYTHDFGVIAELFSNMREFDVRIRELHRQINIANKRLSIEDTFHPMAPALASP